MSAVLMENDPRQRALVLGLGVTGLSCVRYLKARHYDVTVADTRAQPPKLAELRREFPDVVVHTGNIDEKIVSAADVVVVSPGLNRREPSVARALAHGKGPIGDIELFARAAKAPIVAITGANGKSTVTALVGAICRAAGLNVGVGGNIGVPALSLLDHEHDVYVLELSSFQLETTHSLNARAAAVLNITPDHMDRYASLAEYAQAKARIFHGNGTMVLNGDDAEVMRLLDERRDNVRFRAYPPQEGRDYGIIAQGGAEWLARGNEQILPATAVPLPGRHNLMNVLAALALSDVMGVSRAAQIEAIQNFKGLPHRTEQVGQHDGITWINDSKGTNVGATVAALNGFDRPVILIAGGEGKGADFATLKAACREKARAVVLLGRDAHLIAAALEQVVPVERAKDMVEAVRIARGLARTGDVVLLSPACASFDMFRNYEHRGDVFRAAVRELIT